MKRHRKGKAQQVELKSFHVGDSTPYENAVANISLSLQPYPATVANGLFITQKLGAPLGFET